MMSAKDERHARAATLWFTIAHYCVRPWPWILVGLATLVLYPELGPAEKRLGYVYAMRDYLPAGMKGMLVAAFFAAYMSTIATQLNWGASYMVNDFYRRFTRPGAGESHLVAVSRGATLAVMAASLAVTSVMDTISGAWAFIIEAGAGLGLVLILRWFWWRINAWSEIAAMVTPLAVCGWLRFATETRFPETLYIIVAATTAAWIGVTLLTKPTDGETLARFYRRVHPGGPGWEAVAQSLPDVRGDSGGGILLRDWLCGVILVYACLFGMGKILLLHALEGMAFFAVAAAAAWVIWRDTAQQGSGYRVQGTGEGK
jgi:SSS family solute:Na+ symporter